MKWSQQQELALIAVRRFLNSSRQVFRIFGHAGTGKTSLAKEIANNVSGLVLFMAYTGKAASVLQDKGCVGATTIHSGIYTSREKGKAKLLELEEALDELLDELRDEFVESGKNPAHHKGVKNLKRLIKEESDALSEPFFVLNSDSMVKDAELVIIDECSMVNKKIGEDLLSFGTKILVLGDPAQLPPIRDTGYFTEAIPDVMLTEIHRQAADNPIIHLATLTREGKAINLGSYGSSRVIEGKPDMDCLNHANQVLCGRNKTRHNINKFMREKYGYENPLPYKGEKIICGRNNHDKGLLNGVIYTIDHVVNTMGRKVFMRLLSSNDGIFEVCSHDHYFLGKEDDLKWFEERDAEKFDYGYAITVHKSQGSQWDEVLIIDESYAFKKNARRWLYTAITRAAKSVTIFR